MSNNKINIAKFEFNNEVLSFFENNKIQAIELIKIFRELSKNSMKITEKNVGNLIEYKIEKLNPIVQYIRKNDFTKSDKNLFAELIFETRINRIALTEEEARDLFRVLSYTPQIRLLYAKKFDPKGKFGFCFGRAFFANLILLNSGISSDAIKKVFVYGPMKFGSSLNWGFHVATIVAKEGGGYWVLDPTSGKLVTIEEWFPEYQRASVDGRLRIFISDNSRFGRNGWDTPDWEVLKAQYNSELNMLIHSEFNFFTDGMKALVDREFKEGNGVFQKYLNRFLEKFNFAF